MSTKVKKKIEKKLPKKFKAKWVKALRSGKYAQTDGTLKNDTGYCCLGVAAEVCGVDILANTGTLCTENGYDPKKIPALIFGDCTKTDAEYNPMVEKLANYNDIGKSFEWIASYIDRYL